MPKEPARQAIRGVAIRDTVDPRDPIFRVLPMNTKKGRIKDGSEKLDDYVYGGGP